MEQGRVWLGPSSGVCQEMLIKLTVFVRKIPPQMARMEAGGGGGGAYAGTDLPGHHVRRGSRAQTTLRNLQKVDPV